MTSSKLDIKDSFLLYTRHITAYYVTNEAENLNCNTDADSAWLKEMTETSRTANTTYQNSDLNFDGLVSVHARVSSNYRNLLIELRCRCTSVGGFRRLVNEYFSKDLDVLKQDLTVGVDAPKKQFIPVMHPFTGELLLPYEPVIEMGTCAVTGNVAPVFRLTETVYGTFIDYDTVYTQGGWTWYKSKAIKSDDLVEVYNIGGHSVDTAYKNDPTLYYMHGKYFDFNVYESPYFVLGRGYMKTVPEGSIQVGQFTYLPADFSPLRYDSDIMEYLDGFKGAVGEELVRGHKIHQNNTLFMGMELEVENVSGRYTHDIARDVMRVMGGDAMIVSDGSLDDGFEIVSIPATLNYHYDLWKKLCFSDVRGELKSFDTSTCGIHIHMSKEAFSPYALGMFTTFINSPSNADFIDVIASRRPNTYCQRKETTVSKGSYRRNFRDKWGDTHDKYWATNLQKEHTLEVRIFNGNLSYSAIMCNLEFCHALHRYVTHYASHTKLSYLDFISWLTDKKQGGRKSYPFLYEYLRAREYITDTSKGYTVSSGAISDRGTVAPKRETVVDPTLLALHRRASNSSRDTSKQLKTIN